MKKRKKPVEETNYKSIFFAIAICAFTGAMIMFGGYTPTQKPNIVPQTKRHAEEFIEPTDVKEELGEAEPKDKPIINTVSAPNLLKVRDGYYYLFDENVLLPLSASTWTEYKVSAPEKETVTIVGERGEEKKEERRIGAISEFYNEPRDKWTQKFVVQKIENEDDCQQFVEKLVTGIIVSLDDQMRAEGKELTKDNVQFSFTKQTKDDTSLFWHRKGIPKTDDETQFLRCFKGKISGKMILVTYTMKQVDIPDADITHFVRTLYQIQELKAKEQKTNETKP